MANATSTLQNIQTVMVLLKQAADTILSFSGGSQQILGSNVIQEAVEVISAASPLVESFGRGNEVTADDVRMSFAGLHQTLSNFDAEIAKQEQQGQP